jgi:hypothetical protein
MIEIRFDKTKDEVALLIWFLVDHSVEENQSTSTRQLVREFQVSQFVVLLKSKGCPPIIFSRFKHCNQMIAFAGKSFASEWFKSASINLIFCE